MIALVQQKIDLVLTLVKQRQKTKTMMKDYLYVQNKDYLYVQKTEIYKFKAKDNISLYNFCLESISQDFIKDEQSEISLNGTVYDFSVDRCSVKEV